jgi:hypothetical protein
MQTIPAGAEPADSAAPHPARNAELAAGTYADLLQRIQQSGEPRGGWSLRALPRLTDTDLADCLTQYPSLIDDVVVDAQTLAECLVGAPIAGGITSNEYLGIVYRTQIAQAARRLILSDLLDRAEDAEVSAYEAGVLAEAP